MTDIKHQDHVDEVREALESAEKDGISVETTDEAISNAIEEHRQKRVDPEDAVRYVSRSLLREAGADNPRQYLSGGSNPSPPSGVNPQLTASQLEEEGEWIEFIGTVIEAYDPSYSEMDQQGRLADDTGTVRFVSWQNSGFETELVTGETYRFDPVVTTEFDGNIELKLTGTTQAERLEGDDALDIDPDTYTETIEGVLVDFQDQMGLIERCPNETCRRVLQDPTVCPDCGEVESETDIRTKAVVDDGEDSWTVFLNAEQTDSLAQLSFEQAEQLVEKYDYTGVVKEYIVSQLHGEYIRFHGRDRGRSFNVSDFELLNPPSVTDLENVKQELEQLP
ncbi:hypothetical protein [Halorubrum sp. AJ67]|uniref:hypothetical protein n=1 Tax=Halorubrum sp. AJ67 TaxID=1173487 RepID=UPI0003DCAFED|nr:hypothetical protein [Halorubrum sp. AJ67]CDK38259.1 hypothetical protein BN903_459 [Halorubrum sp. AJ67]